MKKNIIPFVFILSLMSCNNQTENSAEGKGYKTPADLKLQSDVMTPEVLWSFGRIGNVSVSPDGALAAYDVTYFNKEKDRGYTDLYLLNLKDGKSTQLTDTEYNESDAAWTPDGKHITYLAKGQLWEMNPFQVPCLSASPYIRGYQRLRR